MTDQNIWKALDLSEDNLKTSYDYLISQFDNFKQATKGELIMEVEVSYGVTSGENRRVKIYTLFIIVPALGNYRKKVIGIMEFEDTGRFPVSVWNHITEKSISKVSEEELLPRLTEELSSPAVISSVETLFKQSIEAKKTTPSSKGSSAINNLDDINNF